MILTIVYYIVLYQDLAKPYDPKKSCWFPLKEGGYAEGIIEATEGDKVSTFFLYR